MELYIENIGKVAKASIDIKGITVIAGENDTGKSTVGKALFSVFNSFYEVEKQIRQERNLGITNILLSTIDFLNPLSANELNEYVEDIINNAEKYRLNPELLKNDMSSLFELHSEKFKISEFARDNATRRIQESLCVSDKDIFHLIVFKKVYSEFAIQPLNIHADVSGTISLKIKDKELNIIVLGDRVLVDGNDVCLHTEAVYIDDPFVMDDVSTAMVSRGQNRTNHKGLLKDKLVFGEKKSSMVEEIIVEKKLEKIYEKISSVCGGKIVRVQNRHLGYQLENSDKILDVENLSTGLKTFAILKTLLMNGVIENHGTIILDEPEIHLHPEWQLLFAELIVLLQKEFDMHILLNTHSPYFLRAIQVYSAKYKIGDVCRYYLSEVTEAGRAYINDVTDNIDKIYLKLSRPLQRLEDERWNID